MRSLIYVIGVLILILAGCQRELHVSVVSYEGPTKVHFCVSKRPNCSGGGVNESILSVVGVGDDGSPAGELMWTIERVTGARGLGEFVYGVVPDGWREESPAKPLAGGQWYMIGVAHYVRFNDSGDDLKFQLLTETEFFARLQSKGSGKE